MEKQAQSAEDPEAQPQPLATSVIMQQQQQQQQLPPNIDEHEEDHEYEEEAEAEEMEVRLVAMRLALMEKMATRIGTLAFVWATVVLLGGFAIALSAADFWTVTVILLLQAARIFTRSHEIEWAHHDSAFAVTATFHVIPLPLPHRVLTATAANVSRLLLISQLASAFACAALSIFRLLFTGSGTGNSEAALDIFYALSLAEALLFLTEKAYWQWCIVHGHLLAHVSAQLGLQPPHLMRRFFYDTYTRCLSGSILDGLRLDLVDFLGLLLLQPSRRTHLAATSALTRLAQRPRTLLKVATAPDLLRRLVDMLSWTHEDAGPVRRGAAEVVARLAKSPAHRERVAAEAGILQGATSLLTSADHVTCLLGLTILVRLAGTPGHNPDDILAKLAALLHVAGPKTKFTKRALQVLRAVADTPAGKARIAETPQVMDKLGHVLCHPELSVSVRLLAVETLMCVCAQPSGRQSVGCVGAVMQGLLDAFLGDANVLCVRAGQVLATLTLRSPDNCHTLARLNVAGNADVPGTLTGLLWEAGKAAPSARILRNMMMSGGEAGNAVEAALRNNNNNNNAEAVKWVLHAAAHQGTAMQEAMMGLAAQMLMRRGIQLDEAAEAEFAEDLVRLLITWRPEVPRGGLGLRPLCVEALLAMVQMRGGRVFERRPQLAEAATEALLHVMMSSSSTESVHHVTVYGGGSVGADTGDSQHMVPSPLHLQALVLSLLPLLSRPHAPSSL